MIFPLCVVAVMHLELKDWATTYYAAMKSRAINSFPSMVYIIFSDELSTRLIDAAG